MSWFEDVTGTSNAERQAWRDSFNDGLAVGAGAAFYNAGKTGSSGGSLGGSKSGSDSQAKGNGPVNDQPVNVVKVVQPTQGGGRGGPVIQKDNGNWSPTQWAPNQAGGPVGTGNPGAGQQAGTGPGTRERGWGPFEKPFEISVKDQATGGHVLGIYWEPSPYQSDVEEFWEPRYGEPGEWLGGVANVGLDVMHNTWRAYNAFDTWDKEHGAAAADSVNNWINDTWNSMGTIEGSNPRINHTSGDLVFTGGGF